MAEQIDITQVKTFLRVDHDEDDGFLSALTSAAAEYIEGATGKENRGSQLYQLAILQLVAHWYENRTPVVTGTIAAEVPLTVKLLIDHIALCSDFPEVIQDGVDQ